MSEVWVNAEGAISMQLFRLLFQKRNVTRPLFDPHLTDKTRFHIETSFYDNTGHPPSTGFRWSQDADANSINSAKSPWTIRRLLDPFRATILD